MYAKAGPGMPLITDSQEEAFDGTTGWQSVGRIYIVYIVQQGV